MKIKLLKKLRKRFQIFQEGEYYYVVDNNSLNWDDTLPYKYLASKDLKKVRQERRELILNQIKRKPKIIVC